MTGVVIADAGPLIGLGRPLLYELHESGYRLSEAVIQAVLEDVGE